MLTEAERNEEINLTHVSYGRPLEDPIMDIIRLTFTITDKTSESV